MPDYFEAGFCSQVAVHELLPESMKIGEKKDRAVAGPTLFNDRIALLSKYYP
jgi:hypothetical protein